LYDDSNKTKSLNQYDKIAKWYVYLLSKVTHKYD